MKNQNLTIEQQAEEYVDQMGKREAKSSHYYLYAAGCRCGQCFACLVKKFTDEAKTDWYKIPELINPDDADITLNSPILIKI